MMNFKTKVLVFPLNYTTFCSFRVSFHVDTDPTNSHALVAQALGSAHLVDFASGTRRPSDRVLQDYSLRDAEQQYGVRGVHGFKPIFTDYGDAVVFGTIEGRVLIWDRRRGQIIYEMDHGSGTCHRVPCPFLEITQLVDVHIQAVAVCFGIVVPSVTADVAFRVPRMTTATSIWLVAPNTVFLHGGGSPSGSSETLIHVEVSGSTQFSAGIHLLNAYSFAVNLFHHVHYELLYVS